MAALLSTNDDDEAASKPVTVSTNTDTAGGIGSISSPSGTTSAGTGSAGGTGAGGQTANAQDVQAITSANQGVNFQPLLDTVRGQGTTARNAIGTANDAFTSALGTFNPFGTSDQSTLDSVLTGTTGLDTGKNLLNKTYSGPATFNNTYDPLVSTYANSASQTQSPNGISSLLGSLNPALSAGERSYDALIYGNNPDYAAQSQGLVNDAADLSTYGSNVAAANTRAIDYRKNQLGAYDAAAKDYVTQQRENINAALQNQMTSANAYDQNVLRTQQSGNLQAPADYYNFDATGYVAPHTFSVDPHSYAFTPQAGGETQYAPETFNRSVDAGGFLNYNPGQIATRDNVATADQGTRYNNAEALLNLLDRLNPTARTASTIGLNGAGLNTAWQSAQNDRDAAAARDQAWLNAMQAGDKKPVAEPTPWWDRSMYYDTGGDISSGGGNAGDGGGSDGGEGAATGGLIKKGKVTGRGKNPFAGLASSRPVALAQTPPVAPTQPTPTQPAPMLVGPTPQGVAQGLARGGFVPPGPPGKDTVTGIPLNNGEFVLRAPSVAELGPQNLIALNQINADKPGDQRLVRNALHAALSKAAQR